VARKPFLKIFIVTQMLHKCHVLWGPAVYDRARNVLQEGRKNSDRVAQQPKLLRVYCLPLLKHSEKLEKMFRKVDLFPSPGEGKETSTLLGPLENTNLNHWTFGWTGTDTGSETLSF
jgi:hypothetical protein